jgi:methionyl aminopeptidase
MIWRARGSRIPIKTPEQIAHMRVAGLVVGQTLEMLRAAIAPGVTPRDLDALAEAAIRRAGAVPSFKGYHGFPATICVSVNEEIVHGIPGDRELRNGDVVSVDCGAIVDGWHGDAAITVGVGEVAEEVRALITVCEGALAAGLAAVQPGGHLGDIGYAVSTFVAAAGSYGVVREYTGHGIGTEMHQEPEVPNTGVRGRGPLLEPGVVLAVEPMVTLGGRATRELADGWTVVTRDGSPAAHFEHTIALTEAGGWVLTALDGDNGIEGGGGTLLR